VTIIAFVMVRLRVDVLVRAPLHGGVTKNKYLSYLNS